MKVKSLIKDKYKDPELSKYEIIYTSATLDYFVTQEESGEIFLYGANKRSLTQFLFPCIKTTVSVETGEFILTDDAFSGIKDLFSISEDELYCILQIKDNSVQNESTVLLFSTIEDCLNMQGFLTYLSANMKQSFLKRISK